MDVARFMPWLFYPQGKNPQYQLDRGCMSPRADLDDVAKRKICAPARHQTPDIQSTAQSLYWLS